MKSDRDNAAAAELKALLAEHAPGLAEINSLDVVRAIMAALDSHPHATEESEITAFEITYELLMPRVRKGTIPGDVACAMFQLVSLYVTDVINEALEKVASEDS
jgi:hypothetical protein